EKGKEEAMAVHSDNYTTNAAYGVSAYSKGEVFLNQLSYVVGQNTFDKAMKKYFYKWQFKHPGPRDFKRVMEKVSGLQLDWYFMYGLKTTRTVDYAIRSVNEDKDSIRIKLERKGEFPMPLDVQVTYKDGSKEMYYIPLRVMRGKKINEYDLKRIVKSDWPWVYPYYTLNLEKGKEVMKVEVDPSGKLADIKRDNNIYPFYPNENGVTR
ncbi:MAG: M1 family aminopeptidase, partial [Flavobacteriales bacterium]